MSKVNGDSLLLGSNFPPQPSTINTNNNAHSLMKNPMMVGGQ